LYGNNTLTEAIEGIPEDEWHRAGVCGVWSVKEIIAHLASFEQLLVDILNSLVDDSRPTPTLDQFFAVEDPDEFNNVEVARRQERTVEEMLAEYNNAYAQSLELLSRIPIETRRQAGLIDWYGAEYDLEDFLIYSYYGHKREHSAQIEVFKDLLNHESGELSDG
jgi:uncharacterized damage-inducible protein DinB